MHYRSEYHSPLGPITLASDGTALTGLWFNGQAHFPDDVKDDPFLPDLPVFAETVRWLDQYFNEEIPAFTPAVAFPEATAFRQLIWNMLCTIPCGTCITYGELARLAAARMGRQHMSAQAVGNAVARNPISIIVPCHRIIGSDGSLTGYAGGIDRKQFLLELEQKTIYRRQTQ